MKTIIFILTVLLSSVIIYAQNDLSPIAIEKDIEQPETTNQSNCIPPEEFISIQLLDIQIIESSKKLLDAEKMAFIQEAKTQYETQTPQLKLSNEPMLYYINEGKCIASYPVIIKDEEFITFNMNEQKTENTFLVKMKFAPKP